jgi:hypothetical protein
MSEAAAASGLGTRSYRRLTAPLLAFARSKAQIRDVAGFVAKNAGR